MFFAAACTFCTLWLTGGDEDPGSTACLRAARAFAGIAGDKPIPEDDGMLAGGGSRSSLWPARSARRQGLTGRARFAGTNVLFDDIAFTGGTLDLRDPANRAAPPVFGARPDDRAPDGLLLPSPAPGPQCPA